VVEKIDLIVSPAYIVARAFSPLGDWGSGALVAGVILTNGLLYGFLAYCLVRAFRRLPIG
jgi:hypothetical protein